MGFAVALQSIESTMRFDMKVGKEEVARLRDVLVAIKDASIDAAKTIKSAPESLGLHGNMEKFERAYTQLISHHSNFSAMIKKIMLGNRIARIDFDGMETHLLRVIRRTIDYRFFLRQVQRTQPTESDWYKTAGELLPAVSCLAVSTYGLFRIQDSFDELAAWEDTFDDTQCGGIGPESQQPNAPPYRLHTHMTRPVDVGQKLPITPGILVSMAFEEISDNSKEPLFLSVGKGECRLNPKRPATPIIMSLLVDTLVVTSPPDAAGRRKLLYPPMPLSLIDVVYRTVVYGPVKVFEVKLSPFKMFMARGDSFDVMNFIDSFEKLRLQMLVRKGDRGAAFCVSTIVDLREENELILCLARGERPPSMDATPTDQKEAAGGAAAAAVPGQQGSNQIGGSAEPAAARDSASADGAPGPSVAGVASGDAAEPSPPVKETLGLEEINKIVRRIKKTVFGPVPKTLCQTTSDADDDVAELPLREAVAEMTVMPKVNMLFVGLCLPYRLKVDKRKWVRLVKCRVRIYTLYSRTWLVLSIEGTEHLIMRAYISPRTQCKRTGKRGVDILFITTEGRVARLVFTFKTTLEAVKMKSIIDCEVTRSTACRVADSQRMIFVEEIPKYYVPMWAHVLPLASKREEDAALSRPMTCSAEITTKFMTRRLMRHGTVWLHTSGKRVICLGPASSRVLFTMAEVYIDNPCADVAECVAPKRDPKDKRKVMCSMRLQLTTSARGDMRILDVELWTKNMTVLVEDSSHVIIRLFDKRNAMYEYRVETPPKKSQRFVNTLHAAMKSAMAHRAQAVQTLGQVRALNKRLIASAADTDVESTTKSETADKASAIDEEGLAADLVTRALPDSRVSDAVSGLDTLVKPSIEALAKTIQAEQTELKSDTADTPELRIKDILVQDIVVQDPKSDLESTVAEIEQASKVALNTAEETADVAAAGNSEANKTTMLSVNTKLAPPCIGSNAEIALGGATEKQATPGNMPSHATLASLGDAPKSEQVTVTTKASKQELSAEASNSQLDQQDVSTHTLQSSNPAPVNTKQPLPSKPQPPRTDKPAPRSSGFGGINVFKRSLEPKTARRVHSLTTRSGAFGPSAQAFGAAAPPSTAEPAVRNHGRINEERRRLSDILGLRSTQQRENTGLFTRLVNYVKNRRQLSRENEMMRRAAASASRSGMATTPARRSTVVGSASS
nr:hypothetical protein HK105_000214 [Polyrhizophydium stewartii]